MPRNDAVLRVVDAIGGLMEFWGFKRNMGRMWTLLYLEPQPLSAADIAERLSLSSGAVSMTLGDLQQWGAVRKTWVPGERRDYYEPETDIWKMVSNVFRSRELLQVRGAIDVFGQAMKSLAADRDGADADEDQRLVFARDRIEGLLRLARIGERLLEAILSGQSVDSSPLQVFAHLGDDEDDGTSG
jgi:HTH-type transcriptional regulator, glycine betaine synthesis regulator